MPGSSKPLVSDAILPQLTLPLFRDGLHQLSTIFVECSHHRGIVANCQLTASVETNERRQNALPIIRNLVTKDQKPVQLRVATDRESPFCISVGIPVLVPKSAKL